MSITTNSLEQTPLSQGSITSYWRVNASTADASGCETIKAAPGSGYELVVQKLAISVGGSVTATIGCSEEDSGVKRVLIGPIAGAAMAVILDFGDEPIVLDPNAALTVDASGAAVIWVFAQGMTRVCESAGIASSSPSASVSSSPSSSASA